MLLLDEATSALDMKTEMRILKILHVLWKQLLLLVMISHREETFKLCDSIIDF